MRTVNIHEAKTHLSKLVDQAAKGEAFIIAKAGRWRRSCRWTLPHQARRAASGSSPAKSLFRLTSIVWVSQR